MILILKLYLVGAIAWLLISLLVTGILYTGETYRERRRARSVARWVFAAPLWPLAVALGVGRAGFRFVRFAFGRD